MPKRRRKKTPTTIRLSDIARGIADGWSTATGLSVSRTISILLEVADAGLHAKSGSVQAWAVYFDNMKQKKTIRDNAEKRIKAIDAAKPPKRNAPTPTRDSA